MDGYLFQSLDKVREETNKKLKSKEKYDS
ncbi:hypothetical protein D1164_19380 [Mariniphaga sediminis]|uniref:Uncharacterized protein n=1 Tax=Mariniphaga sediminis TaxID=1628158 RepID=A0A399CUB2_9BACT|nr:hypothetical protein D1164_19380 [Mariniphaga sediminis]